MLTLDKKVKGIRARIVANRIRHTRWLVIVLLPLVALVGPSPARPPWVQEVLESLGIICLLICLIGRGWTSIYVSGRKNHELVTIGPFSVVRNPLYVFSFIGVVGIGLSSGMITLLVVSAVIFAVYYAIVVRDEEAYLAVHHGEAFNEYRQTVSRWFPKLSLWHDAPATVHVAPQPVLRHLIDSAFFFGAFFFFEVLEYLRAYGGFKPLLYLP